VFYLHDEPACLRFALVQALDANELRDLDGCWRTAESIRRGRPLIIDVSRLISIDERTEALLRRFSEAGASILHRVKDRPRPAKCGGFARAWALLNRARA